MTRASRPLGTITRGTTHPNRLRRVDRWIARTCAPALRASADPVVVDLGYGAAAWTPRDLRDALRPVRPDVEVVGIEIDAARVAAASAYADATLSFRRGGFEVPLDGRDAVVVRAFNVLRQYDEGEVAAAWRTMTARLAPGGLLVEGTCDELGRHAWWVALEPGAEVPRTLTLSTRLAGLERPSDLAERLPKALIHRNVPGERVHELLRALDRCWAGAASQGAFGVRQRWLATVTALRAGGVPVLDGPTRWRLGELTVPWSVVAPG
ncbi:MAG: class I SAM-dependent methyltransferase [Candidatus Nanopelagicales bacterium]